MANRIYQPLMTPVKFFLVQPQDVAQYISRHMDDWQMPNTVRTYEQPVVFPQPWLKDDSINIQLISNFAPFTFKVYDCNNKLIASQAFDTKQQDFFNVNFFIRQIQYILSALTAGYYFFKIEEANLISDLQEIFESKDDIPNTCYIQYKNSEFYGGINFDVPYEGALRVPGILKYKDTASKDTVYADQNEAETMLHSTPYRLWTFYIGGQRGIPPSFKDSISRMLGCDTFKIDGREYTKSEGAQWEVNDLEGYPMAGYNIELREKLNRDSLIYDSDVVLPGLAGMMAVTDTKGFGMDDQGGNFTEFVDVE